MAGAELAAVAFEVADEEGGRPNGFATVAPWETAGAGFAAVAVVAAVVDEGSPSGFATVPGCGVLGAEFVAVVVAGVKLEAGDPSGFATVACGAVEAASAGVDDGVTVADVTFVVTLGAPAELVVGSAGVAVVAAAGAPFGVSAIAGGAVVLAVTAGAAVGVLTAAAALVGVAGVLAVGVDATTLAGVGLEAITPGPAEDVVEIVAVELVGDVVATGEASAFGPLVGATVTISGGAVVFGLAGAAAVTNVDAGAPPCCVTPATEGPGVVLAV